MAVANVKMGKNYYQVESEDLAEFLANHLQEASEEQKGSLEFVRIDKGQEAFGLQDRPVLVHFTNVQGETFTGTIMCQSLWSAAFELRNFNEIDRYIMAMDESGE